MNATLPLSQAARCERQKRKEKKKQQQNNNNNNYDSNCLASLHAIYRYTDT